MELGEREFSIELPPVGLGSYDVVVSMDWLFKLRVEVVVIRTPLANDETLIVHSLLAINVRALGPIRRWIVTSHTGHEGVEVPPKGVHNLPCSCF